MEDGRVEGIYLAAAATVEPAAVAMASAVAGRGLEGDRYFMGAGTFTNWKGISAGQDLTLIEAEAVEALAAEAGIGIEPAAARRNLVTRGISLNGLVGKRFRVGEVECYGDRLCDPCAHLERLTAEGVLRGLGRRGGLRADILTSGRVAVGDPVGGSQLPRLAEGRHY